MSGEAPGPSARSHSRWLAAVLIVALLAHGSAFLLTPAQPSPDSAEYIALGRSLASNGSLALPTGEWARRMPLYPALIAVLIRGTGESHLELTIQAFQFLLAFATTVMLAMIARRLADASAGFIAGIIAALYAPFLYLQSQCLTESVTISLLTAAILIYIGGLQNGREKNGARIAVVGLCLALCALTRANAAILIFPFVIVSIRYERSWRRRTRSALMLTLPTVLCLSAWALRNSARTGAFTLSTTGGLNFYLGHNPNYASDPGLGNADYAIFDRMRREAGQSEVEVDRRLYETGRAFAIAHPVAEMANLWRKLLVYHSAAVSHSAPSLFVIGIGAIVLAGWPLLRSGILTGARRSLVIVSILLLVYAIACTVRDFQDTLRPWVNPGHLVPIGIVALLALWRRGPAWTLLILIYAFELLVGLAMIPLVRLRWNVDGVLIVAVAVAVSHLCRWITGRQ